VGEGRKSAKAKREKKPEEEVAGKTRQEPFTGTVARLKGGTVFQIIKNTNAKGRGGGDGHPGGA